MATQHNKRGLNRLHCKNTTFAEKPTSQDALQKGESEAVGVRYHTAPHYTPKAPLKAKTALEAYFAVRLGFLPPFLRLGWGWRPFAFGVRSSLRG